MTFTETSIKGVFIVDLERREDNRGFFARSWCTREFQVQGLTSVSKQSNVGFSHKAGTLRGVHYQRPPDEEAKLVRCTMGEVFDVAVDLRPTSPTYRQWFGVTLTAQNHKMLYIPEGCAHGYQTLADNSELCYQTSKVYSAESASGVRFDDPAFGIQWPVEVRVISDADRTWPIYTPQESYQETSI